MTLIAVLIAAAAPVVLGDPSMEVRAQALELEIRCVQCQSEPIAQSTAEIAVDMRALIRERIAAGDTDAEIRGFFRQRYGDFVLFRPPFDVRTWALWASPFGLLIAGLAALWAMRRRGAPGAAEFPPEQSER